MAPSNVVHAAFPKPLTEDATRSYTLPAGYYTDPEIFELEKERIFYRTWQYVGPASEVAKAGDYMTTNVVDQGVFVIRGRDGELRAFYNVCQHRAHELLQGKGNVKAVITCPYHAWAYAPDGSLRTARNCEMVAGFDKKDFGLRPVRVEEFCNLVFVNLDDDAAPLAEQAPNLEASIRAFVPNYDELAFTGTGTFGDSVMQAGWKVVVDNYVECYHCGPAHPAFADMIDMACYEHTIDGISAFQLGSGDEAGEQRLQLQGRRSDPAGGVLVSVADDDDQHRAGIGQRERHAHRAAQSDDDVLRQRSPDCRRRAGGRSAQRLSVRPAGAGGSALVRVGPARPAVAGIRPGPLHRRRGHGRRGRACRPLLPPHGEAGAGRRQSLMADKVPSFVTYPDHVLGIVLF